MYFIENDPKKWHTRVPSFGGVECARAFFERAVPIREQSERHWRLAALHRRSCGIPSDAVAYSLNVTVVPIQSLGYLTIWPAGEAQPVISMLNSDGRIKANTTVTPAGTNGGVSVFARDATQLLLDFSSYFAA